MTLASRRAYETSSSRSGTKSAIDSATTNRLRVFLDSFSNGMTGWQWKLYASTRLFMEPLSTQVGLVTPANEESFWVNINRCSEANPDTLMWADMVSNHRLPKGSVGWNGSWRR